MNKLTDKEEQALHFSATAHGGQKYGTDPYLVHLIAVHEITVNFDLHEDIRVAAYLHDTLEDTHVTFEMLVDAFGLSVAGLVEAVTGRGATRSLRNENAYRKIIAVGHRAALLKLCDRIANAEASKRGGTVSARLFAMYQKELPGFERMIREAMRGDMHSGMFLRLARALSQEEKS